MRNPPTFVFCSSMTADRPNQASVVDAFGMGGGTEHTRICNLCTKFCPSTNKWINELQWNTTQQQRKMNA